MTAMTAIVMDLASRVSEKERRMEDFSEVQRFALAGRARFRIVSVATKRALNVRIAYKTPKSAGKTRYYEVTSDGKLVGFLRLRAGRTTIPERSASVPFGRGIWSFWTASSKLGKQETDVIDWFLSGLFARWHDSQIPAGVEVWHVGCCARCGRLLKDPVSVEMGYGPDCCEKLGIERIKLQTKEEVLVAAAEVTGAKDTDWRPTETLAEDYYAL